MTSIFGFFQEIEKILTFGFDSDFDSALKLFDENESFTPPSGFCCSADDFEKADEWALEEAVDWLLLSRCSFFSIFTRSTDFSFSRCSFPPTPSPLEVSDGDTPCRVDDKDPDVGDCWMAGGCWTWWAYKKILFVEDQRSPKTYSQFFFVQSTF